LKSGKTTNHEQPDEELEHIEIELLLEGIFRRYGFDFRGYSIPLLRRRIWKVIHTERLQNVSALQERILHDTTAWQRLLLALSVNVTEMFRNPDFYLAFRQKVVPLLREQPFIRIWHAGCATGEEVYSMAIMLSEEGLLDKSRIYATDINKAVLRTARSGIYPLEKMKASAESYARAGGAGEFDRYYTANYGNAIFDAALKQRLVFSQHNLVSDRAFNRFDVIFCRNVMIYFDEPLQDKVHRLLYQSLGELGVLGLGHRETIRYTPHETDFVALDTAQRLYRKIR